LSAQSFFFLFQKKITGVKSCSFEREFPFYLQEIEPALLFVFKQMVSFWVFPTQAGNLNKVFQRFLAVNRFRLSTFPARNFPGSFHSRKFDSNANSLWSEFAWLLTKNPYNPRNEKEFSWTTFPCPLTQPATKWIQSLHQWKGRSLYPPSIVRE
jgi:hypothetical protein